jgi:hypothetical protein
MPASQNNKRLMPDALGMKALITTASLAVTLGGWAALALARPQPPAAEVPIAEPVAIQAPAAGFELSLAPLPTIAAAPPPPPEIVVPTPPPAAIRRPARQPVIQPVIQPVAPQPAAEPQPVAAPPPAPAAEPAPAVAAPLRVVSAPPRPVTRTRSSR